MNLLDRAELPDLDEDVKDLVGLGVWSLYGMQSTEEPYWLYVRARSELYVLSRTGIVLRHEDNPPVMPDPEQIVDYVSFNVRPSKLMINL